MVVKLDDTTFATNALNKHGFGFTPLGPGGVVGLYDCPGLPRIELMLRCLVTLSVITKAEHEKHTKASWAKFRRRQQRRAKNKRPPRKCLGGQPQGVKTIISSADFAAALRLRNSFNC